MDWASWDFPVWHVHQAQPDLGARWYHYSSINEFDDWAHVLNSWDAHSGTDVEEWFIPPPTWVPASMLTREDPFLWWAETRTDPNAWVEDMASIFAIWGIGRWETPKYPHLPHDNWTAPNLTPALHFLFGN